MDSYPLSSQAPTPVAVELGCDNTVFLFFYQWGGGRNIIFLNQFQNLTLHNIMTLIMVTDFVNDRFFTCG